MATATRTVADACAAAKDAAGALARADRATKDAALARIAELLGERSADVF